MLGRYERRTKEWRRYLSRQDDDELHATRKRLKGWMLDPPRFYGTGPNAMTDFEYDRWRVTTIDEEIARRGLPTAV